MAGKTSPSMDEWLREAKCDPSLPDIGMFLVHNGIVRETAKAKVRQGAENTAPVRGMDFSYDKEQVALLREKTMKMPGIFYLRYWLNEGILQTGDDIMYVLVGGDTRPHVVDALQYFVGKVKSDFVKELEMF